MSLGPVQLAKRDFSCFVWKEINVAVFNHFNSFDTLSYKTDLFIYQHH